MYNTYFYKSMRKSDVYLNAEELASRGESDSNGHNVSVH